MHRVVNLCCLQPQLMAGQLGSQGANDCTLCRLQWQAGNARSCWVMRRSILLHMLLESRDELAVLLCDKRANTQGLLAY